MTFDPFASATKLLRQLKNKTLSAQELMDATIARIESIDKNINAVVVRDFERARDAAKKADKRIQRGESAPLLGLPMTVKESFNVSGLSTTWGESHYKSFKPEEDALTVQRLKAAGAIIIGKTNVPPMLKDWQTYNDLYGTTNNPWDLTRTPGGSSGGAAAALASGMVPLEIGSDLAGSLRTPAHFCGVCAHKPTQDLIPVRGASPPRTTPIPTGADLATVGPMARTVQDLMLAFKQLAGPDEMLTGKGYSMKLPKARHQKLKDFRVLVLDKHPLYPTCHEIQAKLDGLSQHLSKLGVKLDKDTKKAPKLAELTRAYTHLMSAFVGVNLPPSVYDHLKSMAQDIKPDDISLNAMRMRGFSSNYRDYFLQTRVREHIRLAWLTLFDSYDVILCPVMPTVAYKHDHREFEHRSLEVNGKEESYLDQFVWCSMATALGFPATVLPIGLSKANLPIGVQVIGSYMEDNTSLAFARHIEKAFGGFLIQN